MEIEEIVLTLIGPVQPTGRHDVDQDRLSNIRNLTELVDELLIEIKQAAVSGNRIEASMKAIGKHASEFLEGLRERA